MPSTELAAKTLKAIDKNQQLYERGSLGARYASRSELQPNEEAVLRCYEGDIRGGAVLDLGVGGGRTTPFLLELSANYVGVDYSPEMIDRCRARYPAARFEVADARDLSRFPDRAFDFVLFSYNGIDCVDHHGRLQVLGEVHRVLKRRGLFSFSSHNRNFRVPLPWEIQHLAVNPLRHPMRFGKRAVSYPLGIANYLRNGRRGEERDEYRIAVDASYMYSVVNYHITVAAQKKQLQRAGFCDLRAIGMDGRWLSSGDEQTVEDPWIQYVGRRNAELTCKCSARPRAA